MITAAVEDTRHAILEDDFAADFFESAYPFSNIIADIASALHDNEDVDHDAAEATNVDVPVHDDGHTANDDAIPLRISDRHKIYWPLDSVYYRGTVSAVDSIRHHI